MSLIARPRLLRTLLSSVICLLALAAREASATVVPPHDRVIVVVMENKSYDQVRTQPYTASLMAQGATFTNSFGTTHPSQPNYISLWAASTLGVANNNCPAPGSPYSLENLGHACEAAGLRWRAYSENLAVAGSAACSFDGSASSGLYTRKHEPWTQFSNLNHANERPYTDLAVDIANHTVPNLVFVIPNNCHNSHNNTTPGCGVPDADAWLAANVPSMLSALGPHGMLILTWDEDDSASLNHVLTVCVGPQVMAGVSSSQFVNHHTVNRMICEALGLAPFAQGFNEAPIGNIWHAAVPVKTQSWGRVKAMYR